MAFSRALNTPGNCPSHARKVLISIAETSDMSFPSMRKHFVFSFSRVPWHTGHSTFSSMSSTTPGKDTISERFPSPTRNSSSDP